MPLCPFPGHTPQRLCDPARPEGLCRDARPRHRSAPIAARLDKDGAKTAFFSLGSHHDFAVMQVNVEGSSDSASEVGLHHVAFKIGDRLDQLWQAKTKWEAAGLTPIPIDYEVTKSL